VNDQFDKVRRLDINAIFLHTPGSSSVLLDYYVCSLMKMIHVVAQARVSILFDVDLKKNILFGPHEIRP
jgi:hypothetical protein